MKLRRLAKSSIVVGAVALLGGAVAVLIAIAALTSEPEIEYTPAAEHQQAPIPTLVVEPTPTPTAAATLAVGPNPTPATTPTAQVESRSAPAAVPTVEVEPKSAPTVAPIVTIETTPKVTTSPTVSVETRSAPAALPTVKVEPTSTPTVVPTVKAVPTPAPTAVPVLTVNPAATPVLEPPKNAEKPEKPQQLSTRPNRSALEAESQAKGSGQGTVFTWEDGDTTRRVVLQDELVVQETAANTVDDVVVVEGVGDSIVQRQPRHDQNSLPVFRSESGDGLMTLPGGVLLALEPEWDQAKVDGFFSENGISKDRTSELDFIENGFLVETEPGFPSLNLANELAAKSGVIISSPNWWREAQPK